MNDVRDALPSFASAGEGLAAARQLQEQQSAAAALAVLHQVTIRYPEEHGAWGRGADLLLRERRLDEADTWTAEGLSHCPADFHLLHQFARIAEARHDWAAAAQRWREFRRHHPTSWYGYVNGSFCLRILGLLDEAEAAVLEGQTQLPATRELYIEHAHIAEFRRDPQEALRRWTAARDLFPDDWQCHAGAGNALRDLHRFDEADAMYQDAIARNPAEPDLLLGYAQVAEARRDLEAAVQRWTDARDRCPERWLFHAAAANHLRQLGRLDEAEARLAEAQEHLPNEPALFIDYARIADQKRDWDAAQRRWSAVVLRFPRSQAGYMGAAHALRELGRYDEADAMLSAGQAQWPAEIELFVEYARNAEAHGDWGAALQRWKAVREKAPERWDAFARAAAASIELRRYDEADALLIEAQSRFPDNFSLAAESARLAARHSDRAEAIRRWQGILDRFPHEPQAWIGTAGAFADAGRDEDAASCLRQGLDRHAGDFDLQLAAAWLFLRLRLLNEALAAWERIRQDFPDQAVGYIRGAETLNDAGLSADADAMLTEALQRFPHDPEVGLAYATIARRSGNLAEAARRLQAAAERHPKDLPLAHQWVETLLQLRRPAEARAAIGIVLQRFPNAPEIVQQAIRALWLAGERDEAVTLWRAACANPDFPPQETFRLAVEMLNEGAKPPHTGPLLRHLVAEPDSGERYWRPLLAPLLRPERMRRDHADIFAEFVRASPDIFTPAIRDIVRVALQIEVTADDIRRFFDTYVARDRLGIAGCLFSEIDMPGVYHAQARALFEAYVTEQIGRPDWITEAAAAEIVALLQFAAVASHTAYRNLLDAVRDRLDVAALADRNELQSAEGILGSILAGCGGTAASAVPKHRRRLRIALCISGQLRGYQEACSSWSSLGLDRHDTTVFVDTWSAVGLNWARIWTFTRGHHSLHDTLNAAGPDFVRTRYPRLAKALDEAMTASGTVTVPQLQEFYGTQHVRLEDDRDVKFAGRSNQWKMFYKMSAALGLAKDIGQDFDLVIRARPDREIVDAAEFDLREVLAVSAKENVLFMLDHPGVLRDGGRFWLGDQFALGTPQVITAFCNILPDIRAFENAGRLPRDVDPSLPMHFTPFLMTFYRGILVRPIPGVEFGDFINPPLLNVAEIHDLLLQDLRARSADDFDTALLRACESARP